MPQCLPQDHAATPDHHFLKMKLDPHYSSFCQYCERVNTSFLGKSFHETSFLLFCHIFHLFTCSSFWTKRKKIFVEIGKAKQRTKGILLEAIQTRPSFWKINDKGLNKTNFTDKLSNLPIEFANFPLIRESLWQKIHPPKFLYLIHFSITHSCKKFKFYAVYINDFQA